MTPSFISIQIVHIYWINKLLVCKPINEKHTNWQIEFSVWHSNNSILYFSCFILFPLGRSSHFMSWPLQTSLGHVQIRSIPYNQILRVRIRYYRLKNSTSEKQTLRSTPTNNTTKKGLSWNIAVCKQSSILQVTSIDSILTRTQLKKTERKESISWFSSKQPCF